MKCEKTCYTCNKYRLLINFEKVTAKKIEVLHPQRYDTLLM